MKRTTKYVALDVHQASTVASVREEGGRVIARSIFPTDEHAITEFFRGMRGTVHVVFEEGTQAQWLHDLLAPLVERVLVCDRRGETRSTTKRGEPRVVAHPDLERGGSFGQVRGGGIDGRREHRLVDAAPDPEPAREVFRCHDDAGPAARGNEPYLDPPESGAPIAADHAHARGPSDRGHRWVQHRVRRERLGAHREQDGEGPEPEEGEDAHQPAISSSARKFRVMRWVAPQMMWPSTS